MSKNIFPILSVFQIKHLPLCALYFSLGCISAQQNLFNVPSGEITEKKSLFFQHQVNINRVIQNNTTFSLGLGHHAELGCNLYGLDFQKCGRNWDVITNVNNYQQPLNPQFLLNFQKAWNLSGIFTLAIGTQTGMSINMRKKEDQFVTFNYANLVFNSRNKKIKWINGMYFGDKTYLGEGNNIGYLAGLEYIPNKRLHLVFDAIAGNNASSVAVIGPCYYVSKHVALSAGWQKPFPHSKSGNAVVFEFTVL